MKRFSFLLVIIVFLLAGAANLAAQTSQGALKTVDSVDLKRYAGKWYEIAKLPNRFQKQCVANTTAEYVIGDKGAIDVINRCLKKDGQYDNAVGKAKITDKTTNAKLEVRFAPAFLSFIPIVWGDYWIIDLEKDYQYAVVGHPNRKYLWILSRSPEMTDATYQNILRKVESMGYQPNKIEKTPQNVDTIKGNVLTKPTE